MRTGVAATAPIRPRAHTRTHVSTLTHSREKPTRKNWALPKTNSKSINQTQEFTISFSPVRSGGRLGGGRVGGWAALLPGSGGMHHARRTTATGAPFDGAGRRLFCPWI